MIISDWLIHVNYALRGTDDDTPSSGDEDGKYWITLLNRKKSEMYRKRVDWESSYDTKDIDTIAAGENVFDLSGTELGTLLVPARSAYVTTSDGQKHEFRIIKSDEVDDTKQQLIITSQNPQQISFTKDVLTGDQIIGGTLSIPGYWEPADIKLNSASLDKTYIPIDDPYWSVLAVAAQIASNDITYEDKFSDLQAQANDLWKDMVKRNRARTRGNARTSAYSVYTIRSPR